METALVVEDKKPVKRQEVELQTQPLVSPQTTSPGGKQGLLDNDELLRRLYLKERLTVRQIAAFGKTTPRRVLTALSRAGVIPSGNRATRATRIDINVLFQSQLAYLAGFIDGEGCVSITRSNRQHEPHPLIIITNTHHPVIQYIGRLLNTSPYLIVKPSTRHKDIYTIRLNCSADIFVLLEALLPYLIVKRRQAELILQLICAQRELREVSEVLIEEIQTLNRRGKPIGANSNETYIKVVSDREV